MNKYINVIKKHSPKFKEIFKLRLSSFAEETIAGMGWWSFDIIKFDEYMIEHEKYRIREDGSLKDFIIKKYGEEGQDLIELLISEEGLE